MNRIEINGLEKLIKTENFVEGTTGWRIQGDGSAEFNNIRARGEIIVTGGNIGEMGFKDEVGVSDLNETIITGGKISTNILTADNIVTGRLESQDGSTFFDLDGSNIQCNSYNVQSSVVAFFTSPFTGGQQINPDTGEITASTTSKVYDFDFPENTKLQSISVSSGFEYRAFDFDDSDNFLGEITTDWSTLPADYILQGTVVKLWVKRIDNAEINTWGSLSITIMYRPIVILQINESVAMKISVGGETVFEISDSGDISLDTLRSLPGKPLNISADGNLNVDANNLSIGNTNFLMKNSNIGIDMIAPYHTKNNIKSYMGHNPLTFPAIEEDFMAAFTPGKGNILPLTMVTLGLGGAGIANDWNLRVINHPGIMALRKPAGTSGTAHGTAVTTSSAGTGNPTTFGHSTFVDFEETLVVVFNLQSPQTHRFGRFTAFPGMAGINLPGDGYSMHITTGNLLRGRVNTTDTVTGYTVSLDTWYRAEFNKRESGGSEWVDFKLYSGNTGEELWSASLSATFTSRLPIFTAASHGTTGTAEDMFLLDYVKYEINRDLVR